MKSIILAIAMIFSFSAFAAPDANLKQTSDLLKLLLESSATAPEVGAPMPIGSTVADVIVRALTENSHANAADGFTYVTVFQGTSSDCTDVTPAGTTDSTVKKCSVNLPAMTFTGASSDSDLKVSEHGFFGYNFSFTVVTPTAAGSKSRIDGPINCYIGD